MSCLVVSCLVLSCIAWSDLVWTGRIRTRIPEGFAACLGPLRTRQAIKVVCLICASLGLSLCLCLMFFLSRLCLMFVLCLSFCLCYFVPSSHVFVLYVGLVFVVAYSFVSSDLRLRLILLSKGKVGQGKGPEVNVLSSHKFGLSLSFLLKLQNSACLLTCLFFVRSNSFVLFLSYFLPVSVFVCFGPSLF